MVLPHSPVQIIQEFLHFPLKADPTEAASSCLSCLSQRCWKEWESFKWAKKSPKLPSLLSRWRALSWALQGCDDISCSFSFPHSFILPGLCLSLCLGNDVPTAASLPQGKGVPELLFSNCSCRGIAEEFSVCSSLRCRALPAQQTFPMRGSFTISQAGIPLKMEESVGSWGKQNVRAPWGCPQ